MTKGKTIWIATLTVSAASAGFMLMGHLALLSASLGLVFSLANDLFFAFAMRILSLKVATLWPKATAFLLPLAWFVKQAVLFAGVYVFFTSVRLPVVPFAVTVLAYQIARVAFMIVRPEQYIQYLLSERQAQYHALTGGNAE